MLTLSPRFPSLVYMQLLAAAAPAAHITLFASFYYRRLGAIYNRALFAWLPRFYTLITRHSDPSGKNTILRRNIELKSFCVSLSLYRKY